MVERAMETVNRMCVDPFQSFASNAESAHQNIILLLANVCTSNRRRPLICIAGDKLQAVEPG